MIVTGHTTRRPQVGGTKTYADFVQLLGVHPQKLGIIANMYDNLTASYLLEALRNVHTKDIKGGEYESINAMAFEWDINVNYIKEVRFARDVEGTGLNQSEISMYMDENYYSKNDTFKINKSRQLCIVMAHPIRKADNLWEYIVRLVDNTMDSSLDTSACKKGMTTRWVGNLQPEFSEEGFTKYQSNVEKQREHISRVRNDIKFSQDFAAFEDVFINTAENKDGKQINKTFVMKSKEKELMDTHMAARNGGLMFNRSNFDVNGRCLLQDAQGRDLPSGNGILPQIEKAAGKYAYNNLSIDMFQQIMSEMRQKASEDQGNEFLFVTNTRFGDQVQRVLGAYLKDYKTNGTYFFSEGANGKVKVGATFHSYEFGGNQITFKVDRALTLEYPDRGMALCIDLTADKVTGKPAMRQFTVKGMEFTRGTIAGIGGVDGVTSGMAATPVAGSTLVHLSYQGVGVFCPYRSYMITENR